MLCFSYLQHFPIIFNKAAIMNAGFAEMQKRGWNPDCVFFHDIDLLMEDDRNLICRNVNAKRPTINHYGAYLKKYHYKWDSFQNQFVTSPGFPSTALIPVKHHFLVSVLVSMSAKMGIIFPQGQFSSSISFVFVIILVAQRTYQSDSSGDWFIQLIAIRKEMWPMSLK